MSAPIDPVQAFSALDTQITHIENDVSTLKTIELSFPFIQNQLNSFTDIAAQLDPWLASTVKTVLPAQTSRQVQSDKRAVFNFATQHVL